MNVAGYKDCVAFSMALLLCINNLKAAVPTDEERSPGRLISVSDVIRMTRLGDRLYALGGQADGRVARFSPDRTKFTVVLRRGDVEHNSNVYSLLLFRTNARLEVSRPEILLVKSSSSNREGISDLTWSSDNETVTFLAEDTGEARQVYTLNIRTRALTKLTRHATAILSYSRSATGSNLAFVAEAAPSTFWDSTAQRYGAAVLRQQQIPDLIAGNSGSDYRGAGAELFIQNAARETRVEVDGTLRPDVAPKLSPNGTYLVVSVRLNSDAIPEEWKKISVPRTQ